MVEYLLGGKGNCPSPLDPDAPLEVEELPPLRPGDLAREVIQIGYLSGLLHNDDGNRIRVDPSLIGHPVITSYLANESIQAVRRKFWYLAERAERGSLSEYIECFVQEVDERKKHDSGLAQVCAAVEAVRPDLLQPHGIGILAVHCYAQDRNQKWL